MKKNSNWRKVHKSRKEIPLYIQNSIRRIINPQKQITKYKLNVVIYNHQIMLLSSYDNRHC